MRWIREVFGVPKKICTTELATLRALLSHMHPLHVTQIFGICALIVLCFYPNEFYLTPATTIAFLLVHSVIGLGRN